MFEAEKLRILNIFSSFVEMQAKNERFLKFLEKKIKKTKDFSIFGITSIFKLCFALRTRKKLAILMFS